MTDFPLGQLATILSGCMNPDANTRNASEDALKQIVMQPGGLISIFRATHADGIPADLHHLAVINFKNAVRRSWTNTGDANSSINEAEKELVRKELLEFFPFAPQPVRVQLEESLKEIVAHDFPAEWPHLVGTLQNWLGSGDQKAITSALRLTRIVVRKYEYRDDKDRIELNATVEALFPQLLATFNTLLENRDSDSLELAELLKLCCKIFYSSVYMEVPEMIIKDAGQYHGWMNGILVLAEMRAHMNGMPEDAKGRASWPWWKLKKWVYQICYRLFYRFNSTRVGSGNRSNDIEYGKKWCDDYSMKVLHAVLHELSAYSQGSYVTPRVANLLLQLLCDAIDRQFYWKQVQSYIQDVVKNVVLPLLAFDDADAELWHDDPEEYIRKGYDVIEDIYSPKTAAISLICKLCASKKKNQMDFVMALIGSILQEYTGEGSQVSMRTARRMDGALLAIGSLSTIIRKSKKYSQEITGLFQTFILPVFASTYGHLRAKACWVSAEFCETLYLYNGSEGRNMFMTLFQQIHNCLQDSELPVQVDAVVALGPFFDVIDEDDSKHLIPSLPVMLQKFLELANNVESEGVMTSIESVVEKFSDQIAPYAVGVVTALVQQFWNIAGAEAEQPDDLEEYGVGNALAGHTVLRTIITVLEAVSKSPEVFSQMEELLMPIFERYLSQDGLDVIEEVLEIITYLTYYMPTISQRMWNLYPRILSCMEGWAMDYVSEFVPAVDNFISRGTAVFLQSTDPPYLALTNATIEKTFSEQDRDGFGTDEEAYIGCASIIQIILEHCRGFVDHCIAPYMTLIIGTMAKDSEEAFDDPEVLEHLLLAGADAFYYNPKLALQALHQSGNLFYFMSKLGEAVTKRTKKTQRLVHFKSKRCKKIAILGLSSIISLSPSDMPSGLNESLPQICNASLGLIMALKEQEDKKVTEGSKTHEEWDDGYQTDSGDETGDEDDIFNRLETLRRRRMSSLSGGNDEEEDWEDDFFSDFSDSEDDIDVKSPIDDVSAYAAFGASMRAFQAQNPGVFTATVNGMDATAKSALEQLMSS